MYKLPELKYSFDALEPYFDAETMKIHYEKHHQAYINNLNEEVLRISEFFPIFKDKTPEELIALLSSRSSSVDYTLAKMDGFRDSIAKIKNNAGGHINHAFFWESLTSPSKEGNTPSEELLKNIEKDFGNIDDFKAVFKKAAVSHFGSGWVWLVHDGRGLNIVTTQNQDVYSPWRGRGVCLLGLDLWEHSYYLKYQNRRADYVDAFWSVVDWSVVSERYKVVPALEERYERELEEEIKFLDFEHED